MYSKIIEYGQLKKVMLGKNILHKCVKRLSGEATGDTKTFPNIVIRPP